MKRQLICGICGATPPTAAHAPTFQILCDPDGVADGVGLVDGVPVVSCDHLAIRCPRHRRPLPDDAALPPDAAAAPAGPRKRVRRRPA